MTRNFELVYKRLGNIFSKLLSAEALQLGVLFQMMKNMWDFTEEDIYMYRKIAVDSIRENQKILSYEKLKE